MARDLQTGETLLVLNGQKQVVESLVKNSKASEVSNLEIHGVHVFHVGKTRVLVHNNCFDYFKSLVLTDELADLSKAGSRAKSYKRLLAEGHGDSALKYSRFLRAKKTLEKFGNRNIDDLVDSALEPYRNSGLTKAARALDKHAAGQRASGTLPRLPGNPAARNRMAQEILEGFLKDPYSRFKILGSGGGVEVRLANGQGERFNSDGIFSGFVD